MTSSSATARITRTLFAIAIALSAIAFVNWGVTRGIAASIGAALSLLNWFALRWLGQRIMAGQGTERALVSLLVVAKIGLLMAIVFILINRLGIDPVGLAVGLGVLFVGPVVGGLLSVGSGQARNSSAASVAHEER